MFIRTSMVVKYIVYIFLVLVTNKVHPTFALSDACDGTELERGSSEKRVLFTEFKAVNEGSPTSLNCAWRITSGKTLYLSLNYLTIRGDCSESTLTFNFTNNVTTICNKNITSELPLHISEGDATIAFYSIYGSFPHEFKVSYKSYIEVEEPFSDNVKGDIGIILAIVLGIVLLGSMFVAVTFCTIKLYLRCKNRDPEPSEMTAITNIRAETMRAITLKDDFDIKPLSRLVRAKTGSTERILQTREAYA
ncbi:Hypothetical predicted protein [Mytilus galloprovincialis]|uniref:CUB domain-containing protein n=1 Tax=Mytilus galloprovincialis TaxID=29158 RepID=A0A8B6DBW8_MYTGA|nr:Hypothetical predicted protein [Mytilus galloprovincialis]